MSIDLEKLRPIIEDAIAIGQKAASEKHGVPKGYVASALSLARRVGAVTIEGRRGARPRVYSPADLATAIREKPIHDVAAQFGISASTVLRVVAEFERSQSSSTAAAE
jgi:hypothetical protein